MATFIQFFTGLLFGIGLIVAGMTNPAKIKSFLDLAGAWDPSLALVMGGAVAVGLLGFRLARTRQQSLLGGPMRLPTATGVDKRLVLGSLTFGVGWGLGGFCPGPALASLATGSTKVIVFTLAMLAGMAVFAFLERPRASQKEEASHAG